MNLITRIKRFVLKHYSKPVGNSGVVSVQLAVPAGGSCPKISETTRPSQVLLHGSTPSEIPRMIFIRSIAQGLVTLGIRENEAFLRAEVFDWSELPVIPNKSYYFHGLGYWWNA